MPKGNPGPRNLSEMVEAGGLDTAVDLRNRGYSGQRLRDVLSRQFPSAYHQSISALADRSIYARQAARAIMDSQTGSEVSSVSVPRVEGAPAGITATYAVDYTPQGARKPITLHAWIEHSENLTVGDLETVGPEFLGRAEFREVGSPSRLRQWVRDKERRTAEGDEDAAEKLSQFRARLASGNIRLTSVVRGQ